MRLARKFVGTLLLAVLFGYPAVACVSSSAQMTEAQRECCKRMAQECGSMQMPVSHSCCRTQVRQAQSVLQVANARFVPSAITGAIAADLRLDFSHAGFAFFLFHTTAESPPGTFTALRI